MKKYPIKKIHLVALMTLVIGLTCPRMLAFAEEGSSSDSNTEWYPVELMPIRVISVKGDAAKFRAINWMNDGVTGGIKSMGFESEVGDGNKVIFEGHGIPADHDYGANLQYIGPDGFYFTMDLSNFRRWYDVYAGYFGGFPNITPISKVPIDPQLDIGELFYEIGKKNESGSAFSLAYERRTKEGIKTTTHWGTVSGGVNRKVGYSWKDISESTDAVILKGSAEVGGVNIEGEQRAEFVDGRTFMDSVENSTENESQNFDPQTTHLVSTLRANRWMLNDKTYVGLNYQFQHTRHDMLQIVRNYTTADGLTSNDSHNRRADATASRDSHSIVQHFMTSLSKDLSFIARLKQQYVSSQGSGFGEGYAGGGDRQVASENVVSNYGESFSLRYKGIPKTSIYLDGDFQQSRNKQVKNRIDRPELYTTKARSKVWSSVLGARYVPNRKFNMTTQFKYKDNLDKYDVIVNEADAITIDKLNVKTKEFMTRLTWKPLNWLDNSLRFQWVDNTNRVKGLGNFATTQDWIKGETLSRIYTYNVVLYPMEQWLVDIGYSWNQFQVSTPAAQTAVPDGGIEAFDANVYTWLFSLSYTPKENMSFFGNAQLSKASNFESYGFDGIPYGVSNKRYDITLGMQWNPKEDIELKPFYSYYSYDARESLDYGDYSAHVGGLELSFDW